LITEVSLGGVTIQVVNSAIIGLVGTAPQWLNGSATKPGINTPTLVTTQAQAAAFGPLTSGYTIPRALYAIQQQGAGAVIVIDVFDPATDSASQTATAYTAPATNAIPITLGHMGIIGPGLGAVYDLETTVVVTNSGATTTYVEGTDYTIDYVNGLLYTKSAGAITPSEAIKVAFSYCSPSAVTSGNIVGTVTSGVYTGAQCLLNTMATMGITAKLLITPSFYDSTTATGMTTLANTLSANFLLDLANNTTVANAIAARGTSGSPWETASYRVWCCFPGVLFQDNSIVPTGVTISAQGTVVLAYSTGTVDSTPSQWFAGVQANVDLTRGYWFSPSNNPINGVLGPDIAMYMSAFDPNSDTNQLNAAGIVTVFNGFGTGFRVWGNRNAAFPSNTNPTTFIAVRRTLDVIEQSIQVSSLPFLDQPITNGLINSILSAVNGFLRTLIQQGALLTGSAITYNPADNPVTSLQAGQLTFEVAVMPPPPAEEIIYNVYVDISLLANLGPTITTTSTNANVLP
jgi:hypothetical protein